MVNNNGSAEMDKLTLKAKKEQIQALIDRDDKAVYRALYQIYQRQTESEQRTEDTKFRNDIGFSAADAKYLTYTAKWLIKYGKLDEYHLNKVRGRIRRYWKQLAEIAAETAERRKEMGLPVVPLCGRQYAPQRQMFAC
jgi:hypothetical protein